MSLRKIDIKIPLPTPFPFIITIPSAIRIYDRYFENGISSSNSSDLNLGISTHSLISVHKNLLLLSSERRTASRLIPYTSKVKQSSHHIIRSNERNRSSPPKMHILLLGASGRTGREIISVALSRGHKITALIRDPSSLTPQDGLTIITGSPLNEADIKNAITASTFYTPFSGLTSNSTSSAPSTAPDAVIVALASTRESDSPFAKPVSPPRLMTDAHINAISAMEKAGIKRIITVSAWGVGDSNASVFFPLRIVLNYTNMAFAFDDHNALEGVVRESGLDWTLVRPVMLSDGEVKEVKVFGEQGVGAGWVPQVSRKSVAQFVIVDALERGEWVGKTPVIRN
jgi:putative NADH-flavin reductase